ncbi:adenylate kinase family protein [Candidatus Woesearchaeota archaeon]|nr:adenylate kinase family protein [Candidatus Woesearchaeota archaeon]
MKAVIISGTPGTGKTTLSKRLALRLNYFYFDVNDFIAKNKLYESYDRKRKTRVVDVANLNKELIKEINTLTKKPINDKYNKKIPIKHKKLKKISGIVIDSHLSHYLPRRYVDLCIITKCGINELNKRLKKKGYGKNKIQENLQAEIFDICLNEAKERKHKIMIIDTTKGFNIDIITRKIGV